MIRYSMIVISPREIVYMRPIILLIMFCNILAIIASVLRS